MKSLLELLPDEVRSKSISVREIVLPLPEALRAVDILESNGCEILGYEGWVKTSKGAVGHGSAGRYCASYSEDLSIRERASLCRMHIVEDAGAWQEENLSTTDLLHFCITATRRFT